MTTVSVERGEVVLEAADVSVGYGAIPVVTGLDLQVEAGQIVALLGPNGAGKTTALQGLAGALPVQSGEVRYRGERVDSPLHRRARNGFGLIADSRGIFKQLTAAENLRVASVQSESVLDLFPELEDRLGTKAGLLSGGEQQMLAVGRALCRDVRLLVIDELSLGLAPMVVDRLLEVLRRRAAAGVGVLVVEQHVHKLLGVADQVYVLQRGRVVTSGRADDVRSRLEEVEAAYFADAATPGQA